MLRHGQLLVFTAVYILVCTHAYTHACAHTYTHVYTGVYTDSYIRGLFFSSLFFYIHGLHTSTPARVLRHG